MNLQSIKSLRLSKWDWLGWGVAVCVAGMFVTSGFQAPAEKMAIVDIVKVAEESNLGKTKQTSFAKQKSSREALIEFMDKNRVIAPDQLGKLRELSLKETQTDAEKAELEKLKGDIQAKGKRLTDLQTKASLTPEDKQILDDYARQSQNTEAAVNRWFQDFAGEMQALYNQQRQQVLEAARLAAKSVGKAQGFSLVFDANAAPYGANDLTDATLQAINKAP
jgi:Skp family chaperone for outer membrane proteins